MNPLLPILEILANVSSWWRNRSANKNAPDVKEAQKRQDEVNAQARETEAVAKKDRVEVEKDLAE